MSRSVDTGLLAQGHEKLRKQSAAVLVGSLPLRVDTDNLERELEVESNESDDSSASDGDERIQRRSISNGFNLLSFFVPRSETYLGNPLEQSRKALKKGAWQGWLYRGGSDLDKFRKLMHADPDVLKKRDAAGASPLHLMLLYGTDLHIELAFEIISQYPERCEDQYIGDQEIDGFEYDEASGEEKPIKTWVPDEYTGENCLHIAIVNGNVEMVQLLCDTRAEQLKHHAEGKFFQPEGNCYYGELPLSFAVCTNQPEMVRILLDRGADLGRKDRARGNTAMHMAVLWGHIEMYDLLREEWAARKGDNLEPCLGDRRNHEGQTCISLAAACGSVEMFDHVLTSKGQQMWSYGAVTCRLYPVESLDCGTPNAMQYMLRSGRAELLSLPRVRRLQDNKWEVFGRDILYERLLKHCLVLLIFQFALVLPRPSIRLTLDNLRALTEDWALLPRPVCEFIVVLTTERKLVVELREMYRSGLRGYLGMGRACAFENVCSVVLCTAIMAACVARASFGTEEPLVENIALVVASFAYWLYLAWFMLGFQLTGPFIISAFEMLGTDIPAFLMAVSIFMGAFASAMYILSTKSGLAFLMQDFEVCVMALLGQPNLQHFDDSLQVWPYVAKGIIIFYLITVVLVMLNLLIAKMGATYNRIAEQSEREWVLERARMLSSMENEMSPEELRMVRGRYWVKDKFGNYGFQILETKLDNWTKTPQGRPAGSPKSGCSNFSHCGRTRSVGSGRRIANRPSLSRQDNYKLASPRAWQSGELRHTHAASGSATSHDPSSAMPRELALVPAASSPPCPSPAGGPPPPGRAPILPAHSEPRGSGNGGPPGEATLDGAGGKAPKDPEPAVKDDRRADSAACGPTAATAVASKQAAAPPPGSAAAWKAVQGLAQCRELLQGVACDVDAGETHAPSGVGAQSTQAAGGCEAPCGPAGAHGSVATAPNGDHVALWDGPAARGPGGVRVIVEAMCF